MTTPSASIVTSDATKPPMLTMPGRGAQPGRRVEAAGEVEADHRARAADGQDQHQHDEQLDRRAARARAGRRSTRRPSCRRWSAPTRSGAAGAARRTGRKPVRHKGIRRPASSSSDWPRGSTDPRPRRGTGSPRAARRPCPENCVLKCVQSPSRVPGCSQAARSSPRTARRPSAVTGFGGPGALRTAMTASRRREDPQRREGQVGRASSRAAGAGRPAGRRSAADRSGRSCRSAA